MCAPQKVLRSMSAVDAKPWFVYLVRAANGALYCGISDDPQRRFAAHVAGRGARFFHSSPAQALVYIEACGDKSGALRRERAVKRLSKREKEKLVAGFTTDGACAAAEMAEMTLGAGRPSG